MRIFPLLPLLALIAIPAFAANMHQVNNGAYKDIDEHGVCKRITNNHASGRPVMVPTRTANEWTAFRNNRPSGVGMTDCPPTCSGTLYGGYCWYISPSSGGSSNSCDSVCSSRGGTNIAGTRDYAGSSGTNARCQAVAQALGQTILCARRVQDDDDDGGSTTIYEPCLAGESGVNQGSGNDRQRWGCHFYDYRSRYGGVLLRRWTNTTTGGSWSDNDNISRICACNN